MEFLRVRYWRRRGVFVDGQLTGMTNRVLSVGEGRHRIELSPPKNYEPPERIVVLRNTTRQRPREVSFLHESQ